MISKFKTLADIIFVVKNWFKAILVKFRIVPLAEIRFRNGYRLTIDSRDCGKFMESVNFFRDFPTGKIENGLVYFNYGEREFIFDCGDRGPYLAAAVYRDNYGGFFSDENINGKTVIDLGCSIGDTPIYFVTRGAKRVIGVEMLPYRCKLAIKNISLNKMDAVCQIVNAAIGGKRGKLTVDARWEYSEHYIKLDDISKKGEGAIEIPVITLGDIVGDYNIEEGSVIKSDLQGGNTMFF